jgi:hypothetical protein
MNAKTILYVAAIFILGLAPAANAASPGIDGVLTLSSGQEYMGLVSFTQKDSLKVFDLEKKKFIKIPLSELAAIETKVTKKEMRKNWVFKEEGSPEKIETGGTYPRMDFEHTVTLTTGAKVRCHVVGTVYIRQGDTRLKFILKKKERGEAGKKLTDIVYVTSIRLNRDAGGETDGRTLKCASIEGVKMLGAFAVNRADAIAYQAKVASGGNSFEVKGLPEGVYDLFIETNDGLHMWLAVNEPDNLSTTDKAGLGEFVQSVKGFFDDKSPVAVFGSKKRARALIEMKRFRKTSYTKKAKEPIYFRRLELWTMHRNENRWIIDKRTFLFREKVPRAETGKAVHFDEELGGKTLTGETTSLAAGFTPKE